MRAILSLCSGRSEPIKPRSGAKGRQVGCARVEGGDQSEVRVLLEFEFGRNPSSAARRNAGRLPTRVAGPRERRLSRTAGGDQLIVDQIRRGPDQLEIAFLLSDDLVSRGERDKMGEPCEIDTITVGDAVADGVVHGREFAHSCAELRNEWRNSHKELPLRHFDAGSTRESPRRGADLVPYIDIGYRDTRLHDLLSPEQEPLVSSLEDIADREFAERAFDWDGEPPWENGETRLWTSGRSTGIIAIPPSVSSRMSSVMLITRRFAVRSLSLRSRPSRTRRRVPVRPAPARTRPSASTVSSMSE